MTEPSPFHDIAVPVPGAVYVVYVVSAGFGDVWTDSPDTAMIALRNQLSVITWVRHHVRGWEHQGPVSGPRPKSA